VSIITMVMTDGRAKYMEPTMASMRERVTGKIALDVIHDDSGDAGYRAWLHHEFPDCEIIGPPAGRSGFCGAYRSAWRWLTELDTDAEWVFQTEDDFTFETLIDLDEIVEVLDAQPHLAQMQLRRQPWWTEPQDGGFIEQWPDLYTDAGDGTHHWLEHRRNWSTNPGVFRRSTCARGWPGPPGCEAGFGDALTSEDPDLRFAVWGRREDPPRVWHIGHERIGHSY
jgi:hypothetical protein